VPRRGAICTIIAKNYMAHARSLMESARQFHPDLEHYVILVDRPEGFFDPQGEPFTILQSTDLDIPNSRWFHFKYTILELCTAVKPYGLLHLLERLRFDFVIYLDPDILLLGDLNELTSRLQSASMIVTPHVTEPIYDGQRPCELDFLRAGVYNLGFLAISRTPEALAYLHWWRERLHDYCVVDLPRGLFLDQRWADLAPCFISHLDILRDPAYNVAYWNLGQRQIDSSDGKFLVNGSPIRFFHFSGFDPYDLNCLSKHQNRIEVRGHPALRALLEHYAEQLFAHGHEECRRWPYAYGFFNNGAPIPDLGRSVHMERKDILDSIEDPFSDEGYRACVAVWNEQIVQRNGSEVSRLGYRLYHAREELDSAMPDIFGGHFRDFFRWLRFGARQDRELPYGFLSHVGNCDGREPDNPTNKKEISAPSLTRLAGQIYHKRPYLRAVFPEPAGKDRVKYLAWLLSYGHEQHNLPRPCLDAVQQHWTSVLNDLPNWRTRFWYRTVMRAWAVHARVSPVADRFQPPALRLSRFVKPIRALLKGLRGGRKNTASSGKTGSLPRA